MSFLGNKGGKSLFLTFFMFKMVKHSRRIHTFEASNWTQRYGGMTKYANKFPNLPIFWICEGNSPANSSTMPVHPCMHIRVHAKKEKMKERGEIGDLSKDFLRDVRDGFFQSASLAKKSSFISQTAIKIINHQEQPT